MSKTLEVSRTALLVSRVAPQRTAWSLPAASATQQDKRDRARACRYPPTFVPVDFGRDRLDEALATAGHRADRATTWIWEGVCRTDRAQVAATVTVLSPAQRRTAG